MDTEPIIGDRWEKLRHYSGSGQSKVYIVRDLTGEHAGDLVLKQIDNLRDSRDARFRNEVEAAIRLRHENIVPVIAHSDFSKSEGVMYLVMPLAAAGSLNTRVGLYKGQVDSTITVAKGLAAALAYAHSQGVIHRDVKPENILFQAENHRPWLADFGICLLANMPRVTEDREIVGPRLFMAPELEDGGQLNVTCAADLYSLGKVIYFMISGGRVFSREQHRDPSYDLSGESGRHAQIWLLLDRLICPLSDRIRSATDVTERLEKIENFARNSTFSLSPEAKRRIDGIVRKDAVQSAAVQKHQEQERQKAAAFEGFARDVATTTNTALNLFAHEITQEGYITATVIEAGQPKGLPDRWDAAWGGYRQIMPVWVASMRVVRQGMRPPEFFLSLFLAYEAKVTVRVAQPGIPLPPVSSTPDDAILFPIYYQNDGRWGFLIKNQAGIFVPSLEAAAGPQARMLVNLRPNEWPADGEGQGAFAAERRGLPAISRHRRGDNLKVERRWVAWKKAQAGRKSRRVRGSERPLKTRKFIQVRKVFPGRSKMSDYPNLKLPSLRRGSCNSMFGQIVLSDNQYCRGRSVCAAPLQRLLLLALAALAACSHNPDKVSAENFRGVLQAYFDHQPPVAAPLSFSNRNLVCQPDPHGCPEQERGRLKMLVRTGLLAVASQSAGGMIIYRVTQQGARYLHPRVMGAISSGDSGTTSILGYSIAEGHTVVTKIDSYTKIGTDAEGAESTTVWFIAENQPYEWVRPYVAQEAPATHLGQSAPGKARLVLTNKGWRVTILTIDWPQVSPAE